MSEGCQPALEVVEGEPQVRARCRFPTNALFLLYLQFHSLNFYKSELDQVFIPNTEKAFTYDYALPGDASNETTYNLAVAGMIPRLFEVT